MRFETTMTEVDQGKFIKILTSFFEEKSDTGLYGNSPQHQRRGALAGEVKRQRPQRNLTRRNLNGSGSASKTVRQRWR